MYIHERVYDIRYPCIMHLIIIIVLEAWLASSNSKDTIALTIIISPDGLLALPNAVERYEGLHDME
jgi:hypothetical protein